jgi:hypothetical protein
MIVNEEMQVLIDKVKSKEDAEDVDGLIKHIKYRADKLIHTKKIKHR